MPFQPKGDQAYRTIIAQAASNAAYGQLITFTELAARLHLDPMQARDQIRQAVASARPLLLRDSLRALVSVRGQGYRVARPGEQAGMAQQHRRRADKQMSKALELVNYADESQMTKQELDHHRAVAVAINLMHQRMTGAEHRLNDLDEAVKALQERVFGHTPSTIQGQVETPVS